MNTKKSVIDSLLSDEKVTFELVQGIITAAGGSENIVSVDPNISRIELGIKESSAVDVPALRELGTLGVVVQKRYLQLIFGRAADLIASSLIDVLGLAPQPEDY